MRNQTNGPNSGMRRLVLMSVVLMALVAVVGEPAFSQLPGDYNLDGIVSHADYSVLADNFGQLFTFADFDVYRAHYGQTASLPGVLPFEVNAALAPGGNVEWTFTFSNVDGALAGHLNISTNGPGILSAQGGPSFLDNGQNPVGVPGVKAPALGGGIGEGISISGNMAFAALGTTLSTSPLLHNSHATLEFLRLVTAGTQPTMLTFTGEYGYQANDYRNNGSASLTVPEPASWALTLIAATLLCTPRTVDSRRLICHWKPCKQRQSSCRGRHE